MTRDREDTLLKLLAIQPETKDRLIVETGWYAEETVATLESLVRKGMATYRNGGNGCEGKRLYYPTVLAYV